MKKSILFLINFIFILISCNENKKEKEPKSINNLIETKSESSTIKSEIPKFNMNKGILIYLFDNISNEEYINNKVKSIDFKKKANGIYISQEEVTSNKPKHWIHITNLGDLSNISYSTADKTSWDKIIEELEKGATPKAFDDKSSAKSIRYTEKIYTFETYEPKNGVNLSLNELYQVFILKTKEK